MQINMRGVPAAYVIRAGGQCNDVIKRTLARLNPRADFLFPPQRVGGSTLSPFRSQGVYILRSMWRDMKVARYTFIYSRRRNSRTENNNRPSRAAKATYGLISAQSGALYGEPAFINQSSVLLKKRGYFLFFFFYVIA